MFYIYILRSLKNDNYYIGSTGNVKQRLALHNNGRVKSTKAYRPWQLLEFQTFLTRGEAVRHEKFLKSHQQKEILKAKYGAIAKW